MTRTTLPLALILLLAPQAPAQTFQLAPAVALEAEDFTVEKGWRVVQDGQGNYMVDMVGFNHISGERLLCVDEMDDSASAFHDVTLPEAGRYRLWVRYEYPAFCETRFGVRIEQGGKTVFEHVMGTKDSPRFAFGDPKLKAQHDPAWGSEGLMDEPVTTPELQAGKARIVLRAVAQPQAPGVSAGRHLDLVYLTRDLDDGWLKHYARQTNYYPILDAFRDSRGARWEVRFTNRGDRPADYGVQHVYNRLPWYVGEPPSVRGLAPGRSSDWVGLKLQDTTHFGMTQFTSKGAFDVELRPAGGAVERKLSGDDVVRVYLPPYPGKGEKLTTPEEAIDAILAELRRVPAIGKKPTRPLCYGGWMPLGVDSEYGRQYARLYAELGFRSLHPAHSGPAWRKNLAAVGIPLTRSWSVGGYRNPPTPGNIEKARQSLRADGLAEQLLWYDYGDEIAFAEWMAEAAQAEVAKAEDAGRKITPQQAVAELWIKWLQANRATAKLGDYWLAAWGPFDPARLRPDSSAAAAAGNPRLYVDSLLFYEETAIRHVAAGMRAVKAAFGPDVLCGCNYSGHPFYYPTTAMYVKWFRGGAADMGRHSEYFWQIGLAGPMVNGYLAEHFRCGFRNNPRAVLRQYTMPHAPGNTDASFQRTAYTHLAHGATMLDFFGIGLNESFTENHIDHRAVSRYRCLRDVTHAVGFVEDLLPEAKALPSPVALLVSDSTERWDFAGIAQDQAGHASFGPDFRKTRLAYHQERVGLWTALTFLGSSPDLLIEQDVTAQTLAGYKVLVVVGDCLPPALAPELEKWVKSGGVVLATAGAGRFDPYRQPNPTLPALFGLDKRDTEERTPFFRPRQELPFLQPVDLMTGDGWKMPVLATRERITPAKDCTVLAKFDDGGAALTVRSLGKGRVFYAAALPGVSYVWTALQPPRVPDRGPGTHTVPTAFDPGARALLEAVLKAAAVDAPVKCEPALLDARVLKAPGGYVVPVANYQATVGGAVTLNLLLDRPVKKASSAVHGDLKFTRDGDRVTLTLPKLEYGDVLRLE